MGTTKIAFDNLRHNLDLLRDGLTPKSTCSPQTTPLMELMLYYFSVPSKRGTSVKNDNYVPHTRHQLLVCWLDVEVLLNAHVSASACIHTHITFTGHPEDNSAILKLFRMHSISLNTDKHRNIPGLDSRGGEQVASQAAVGVAFSFDLRFTLREGLDDFHKGLWKNTRLVVDRALWGGNNNHRKV